MIVADENMPKMRGSELLGIIAREFPAAGRILLTGQATVETAVHAVNHGRISRLLLKPCPPEDLREAIELAITSRIRTSEPAVRVPRPRRVFLVNRRGNGHDSPVDHASRVASELLIQAQKLVALSDPNSALAYEISARLRAQTGNLHTVGNFIASTRNSVLHPSVDTWVLHNVLDALREHGAMLERAGISISLNIPWQSLARAEFLRFLNRELSRSGVSGRLLIEIRQPTLLNALQTEDASLRRLLESDCFKRGTQLCIDAVDAEISGVPRCLPVAAVKIDGQCVRDILTNRNSESVVRAVVEWAQHSRIDVAATGIETPAIAGRLRSLGVLYGQGTAFGVPEPLARVLGNHYRFSGAT